MKIFNFFKESYAELKKVSWPSRDDVMSQTVVVVASLIVVAMALGVIDLGALQTIVWIISLGKM